MNLPLHAALIAWTLAPAGAPSPAKQAPDKQAQPPDVLTYTVHDLRNDRGSLRCGLYAEADNWLEGDPAGNARALIRHGEATCVFRDVPPGIYAIAALHDEDDDGEMDTNLLGIPEEGHSASKNAQEGELKPDWDDARFEYRGGELHLKARMEY
ncbi:MAG: DUF2141 domain-containing protein [Myxococcales bacterium]|nr:DUF2141 domain-containing protein [Myxococcales bacterium]